ncbi:MAG: outer membrane protein transport protein, partial [Moraxellaceae bacterium]|nr:outer membrane protein transport protein [Moraxellaceae bacterium]
MNKKLGAFAAIQLLVSMNAVGAGFDVPVIASAMQGSANANSAETRDPSVIFYNPAGIAHLRGRQISNSISVLSLTGKVENEGTTGTPPPFNTNNSDSPPGATISGGKAGTYWPKLIGSGAFFASVPWNDEITLGFGLFPAAGGNINYKADWFGRYFSDSTAVEIVNANTVAAIRFDDKHSLGFGTSLLIGHLKQKLHIDIDGIAPYLLQPVIDDIGVGTVGSLLNGILGVQALSPSLINSLANLGISAEDIYQLLPPNLKGTVAQLGGQILLTDDSNGSGTIEMFGYGLGWNIGYMFRPDEKSQIGIAYRSESRMYMRGEIDWEVSQVSGLTDNIAPINGLPAPDGSGNVSASDFLANYYRPDATTKSLV